MKTDTWPKKHSTVAGMALDLEGRPIATRYYVKMVGSPSSETLTLARSYSNLLAGVLRRYAMTRWPSAISLKSVSVSRALTSPAMFEEVPDHRIFAVSLSMAASGHARTLYLTAAKPFTLALPNLIDIHGSIATIRHTLEANFLELSSSCGSSMQSLSPKIFSKRTRSQQLSLDWVTHGDLDIWTGDLMS